MTFAPASWPAPPDSGGPAAASARLAGAWAGAGTVWRAELRKMAGQLRVRAALAICAGAPFLVVLAFSVQASTPSDTLFGQWVHTSGWAIPMVMLSWCGQWLLPALVAVVAGDIFSAEDHLGTWKTVLTRSRSRGEVFTGKLAAALTYALVAVTLLGLSAFLAGLVAGAGSVVGLGGQLVSSGTAGGLVAESWATQIPPALAYVGVAAGISVLTRNSIAGVGGPVALGLVLQLLALIDLPLDLRHWLLSTPFSAWLDLWITPATSAPVLQGLATSAAWGCAGAGLAWFAFRSRDMVRP